MLDPRIYRAALVPVFFALIICAFALSDRPRPIGTTLAPDAFRASRALADTDRIATAFPTRRPGDAGDAGAARRVAGAFRDMGSYQVSRPTFQGETADGKRTLTTVIARQVGQPGPGLVVVAHRDALGRDARAELSGTGTMLELARVVAGGRLRRTVTFVSTSGGSAGLAGARDLVSRLGRSVDAVLVLGDVGGRAVHRPFVVGWSTGDRQASLRMRRTVEAAVRREAQTNPGGPRATTQWVRLAFPITIGEQGPFVAAGLPSVLLSSGGERPPDAGAPVAAARVQAFGQAALRTLTALDNAPDLPAGSVHDLVTRRKVLPAWAVRLLVGTLLLAPLLTTIDGFARARRRHEPVAPWVWRLGTAAATLVVALLFAWMLGVTGLLPATPPEPVPAGAIPIGGTGEAALVAMVLIAVLAWLVVRPAVLRNLAGRVGTPGGPGAGIALLIVWCAVAVVLWLVNPYAAALLIPGAHGFPAVVAPELRLRRALAVLLVVVAALPFLLVDLSLASQLAMGPVDFVWACVLLVAGGVIGPLGWVLWSLVAVCLVTAFRLALRAKPTRPEKEDGRVTMRGPLTYAGPGSLGGTESALRR